MRKWIPITTAAIAVTLGTPTTLATAAGEPTPTAPYTAEDGSYPNRADIHALTGADLIEGDGNITLVACSSPYQIMVWARNLPTDESRVCFAAANTGYLRVNIPRAYRIETNDRDIKANVSIEGTTEDLTVPRDTTKGFGEANPADPKQAVLLEMRVTGSATSLTPPPMAPNPYAFVGKLRIGQLRTCTAVLVDPRWALTAASCFAADGKPAAGKPVQATTLTVGRSDLNQITVGATRTAVELVPHPDRDLVMVKLDRGISNVKPAALATTATTADESVKVAGFGRTSQEWAPTALHNAPFKANIGNSADLNLTPSGEGLVCQGDAGGPVLRESGGNLQLLAITSRSWQGGCLGATQDEERTDAVAMRTDDIRTWITGTAFARPGDMNGDNKPDLVAVDDAGKLLLYPGAGTGAIGAPVTIGTGGWSGASVTHRGDWNGDAMEDIVAIVGGEVRMYPNLGNGTIGSPTELIASVPTSAQVVGIGDTNRDGKPDLLITHTNKLFLYPGAVGTAPAVATPITIGTGGWDVMELTAPGDADKDGRVDLLARDTRDGILYHYAGQPDGKNFSDRTEYGRGYTKAIRPLLAGAADADLNGTADMWATANDGTLKFYKGGSSIHGPIDGPSIQVGTGGWGAIQSLS
ncbi:FG-GAP-like repeat-containing protein [Streptomyces sp. NPDC006487]|uniref:FG-GAP-like repeat-containing protein n=1 Tax=Streptomyces sp. NPDC006487 TaxID=3364748 RepID=UPI0036B56830